MARTLSDLASFMGKKQSPTAAALSPYVPADTTSTMSGTDILGKPMDNTATLSPDKPAAATGTSSPYDASGGGLYGSASDPAPNSKQDLIYQSVLSAVPTIIGAAFGNTGGAVGAQAGQKGLDTLNTLRTTQVARDQAAQDKTFDRAVKTQQLSNEANKNVLENKKIDEMEKLRRGMQDRTNQQRDMQVIGQYQEAFNKDPEVVRGKAAAALVPEIRQLIQRGTGQDFKAAQIKLANLFNGGRPNYQDVLAFRGSQELWDKVAQNANLALNDKIDKGSQQDLLKILDTMDSSNKANLDRIASMRAHQAAYRTGIDPNALKQSLSLQDLSAVPEPNDADERNALIQELTSGG